MIEVFLKCVSGEYYMYQLIRLRLFKILTVVNVAIDGGNTRNEYRPRNEIGVAVPSWL